MSMILSGIAAIWKVWYEQRVSGGEAKEDAPTIKTEPIKRGKWIEKWFGYGYKVRCSKCGCLADQMTDYCPNCGARMEVSNE